MSGEGEQVKPEGSEPITIRVRDQVRNLCLFQCHVLAKKLFLLPRLWRSRDCMLVCSLAQYCDFKTLQFVRTRSIEVLSALQ